MGELFTSLVANVIWALLGVLGVYTYRVIFNILPTKRLWKLRDPKNLLICVATSTRTDTGKYLRPATGIGQVQALALIFPSLSSAYRDVQVKNILLSDEQMQSRIENDLIILGGPKNNQITRKLLDKLRDLQYLDQIENDIIWRAQPNPKRFTPTVINGIVTRDYGIIVRMENPFSPDNNTVCLFSGGHTYGTVAAAKYFVSNLYNQSRFRKNHGKNFVMVIGCDVIGGYPVSINVEREKVF